MRETDKILSIRLSPDGLSFWTANGREECFDYDKTLPQDENLLRGLAWVRKKAGKKVGRIHIYPDTAKTVLIPNELFDPGMVSDYLGINGIAAAASDRLIVSDMNFGGGKVKIVTAVDGAWVDVAGEVFEGRAEFLSPFVINRRSYLESQPDKDFTALYLTARNVYITVYEGGDRMLHCEVLPHSSPADILYYMTELAVRFDILKSIVHIKGPQSRETVRTLRKIFKKAEAV